MEEWPSGLRHRFAKPAMGFFAHPRVRISLLPYSTLALFVYRFRTSPFHGEETGSTPVGGNKVLIDPWFTLCK